MQDRQATGTHLKLVAGGRASESKPGRAVSTRLRAQVIKEAGLGECSQLCDAFQMERVCDYLDEAFKGARSGSKSDFHLALQKNLVEPLRRYLPTLTAPSRGIGGACTRMEYQPTLDLIAATRSVISGLQHGPWSEAAARSAVHRLRYAWSVWISYVASYWLTVEVPRRLVEKQERREQGRLGGQASKQGSTRSTSQAAKIVEKYEKLNTTKDANQVAGAVALALGVTSTYVRRVWKKHVAANKAKQQASL